jgi:cap1 methyltransferase
MEWLSKKLSRKTLFKTNEELVKALHSAKSQLDNVDRKKLFLARKKLNPPGHKGVFINRAALKLESLHLIGDIIPNYPFVFCDICSGPGGFTEYLFKKCGFNCSGYGFTLKGPEDFKINRFNSLSKKVALQQFILYYGVDGTGNITNPDNIRGFAEFIKDKVDLVTADGGIDVNGDENFQEEHLKELILCQIITAIITLKKGGTFVCKLFDTFTPFTVYLIYTLYLLFDKICIVKPSTSRPANSEKYIICKGFEGDVDTVSKLFGFIGKTHEFINKERMETHFISYIEHINYTMTQAQIKAINNLVACTRSI